MASCTAFHPCPARPSVLNTGLPRPFLIVRNFISSDVRSPESLPDGIGGFWAGRHRTRGGRLDGEDIDDITGISLAPAPHVPIGGGILGHGMADAIQRFALAANVLGIGLIGLSVGVGSVSAVLGLVALIQKRSSLILKETPIHQFCPLDAG